MAECFLLAIMAYDQYVAICQLLQYSTIMRMKMCVQITGLSWVKAFFMLTNITVTFLFCWPNQINHFFCELPAILQLACMDTYVVKILKFALSVIVLMLPFCFIVISYIHISRVVLNMRSAKGRNQAFSTCATHLTVVTLFYNTISFNHLHTQSNHATD